MKKFRILLSVLGLLSVMACSLSSRPNPRPFWRDHKNVSLRSTNTLPVAKESDLNGAIGAEWILGRATAFGSEAEYEEMLGLLGEDGSVETAELRQLVVRRWAEVDGAAAARWVGKLPSGAGRRLALKQVAIAWANQDLGAATQWVEGMAAGAERDGVTLDVGYEAARRAPKAALALAGELEPSRERNDLLVHALSQWAAADAGEAVAWAERVSDAELRQELVATVAVAVAEENGAAAAELVARSLEAGEEQDRAAVSIVQRWAYEAPEGAAAWVAQFPDTAARTAALRSLVEIWTEQNSEAAAQWLAGLPEGPLRELGQKTYEQTLTDSEQRQTALIPEPEPEPELDDALPLPPQEN